MPVKKLNNAVGIVSWNFGDSRYFLIGPWFRVYTFEASLFEDRSFTSQIGLVFFTLSTLMVPRLLQFSPIRFLHPLSLAKTNLRLRDYLVVSVSNLHLCKSAVCTLVDRIPKSILIHCTKIHLPDRFET